MIDPNGAQQLWQRALIRAVKDLCSPAAYEADNRVQVERWVGSYPTASFREVCEMAGWDHRPVHRRLSEIMALPVRMRRAACPEAFQTVPEVQSGTATDQTTAELREAGATSQLATVVECARFAEHGYAAWLWGREAAMPAFSDRRGHSTFVKGDPMR